jgi:ATP synthase F1 gamma subunit
MSKMLVLQKAINTTLKIKSIVGGIDIISLQKTRVAIKELALKTKYWDAAQSALCKILSLLPPQTCKHLYVQQHIPQRETVMIFGMQAGMVGAVQTMCLAKIQSFFTQNKHKDLQVFTLGRRMTEALQSVVAQSYPHVTLQEIQAADLLQCFHQQCQDFSQQRSAKMSLIYPYFINISSYIMKIETFLPLSAKSVGMTPHYNPISAHNAPRVLFTALKLFIDAQSAFCLAHCSVVEYSARYWVAHAAEQACEDKSKALRLLYNKTRQYKITQELTEASAGNIAYDDR